AARDELFGGEAGAADTDRLGTDRPGGGDVPRRVADHDHATRLDGNSEHRRAALGTEAHDDVPVLVIAAEPTEAEVVQDVERSELRPRPRAYVSRAEPDRHPGARARRLQELADAAVEAELRRLRDLPHEQRDVVGEDRVDRVLRLRVF